jgi:hypothetical protein
MLAPMRAGLRAIRSAARTGTLKPKISERKLRAKERILRQDGTVAWRRHQILAYARRKALSAA